MTRHFITVEWCNDGYRGVFCSSDGNAAAKDGAPHTQEEMDNFLGPFTLVLSPRSEEMDEADLSKYNRFRPLYEYSGEWGIALTKADWKDWWCWLTHIEEDVTTKEVSDE